MTAYFQCASDRINVFVGAEQRAAINRELITIPFTLDLKKGASPIIYKGTVVTTISIFSLLLDLTVKQQTYSHLHHET